MLEQIAEFKRFLFDNFSNVGMISVISTACLIVFSFALREVFSWFTKTDKLRKDVQSLKNEVKFLQGDIRSLSERLANTANIENHTPQNQSTNTQAKVKASAFPLNH